MNPADTPVTVLIIEDETRIADIISTILETNQYQALIAATGKEALPIVKTQNPDLILLDLGLPDIDGTEVLAEIRSHSYTPVIIISARDQEIDKITALDMGADDYMTKPFGNDELLARIRAALRYQKRRPDSAPNVYQANGLFIDFDKHHVSVNGQEVRLTPIEYKMISILAQNAGRIITYQTLIDTLWGCNSDMDNQILRVNMANIRRKIEPNPSSPIYISTQVGIGYQMIEQDIVT